MWPSPLPWGRPRLEPLLLALVAAAALAVVLPVGAQDVSRLCLTDALVHGRLTVDGCIDGVVDRSRHGGHLYSNKAPGLSALAVPAFEAVGLPADPARWDADGDWRLWTVRVATSGVLLLLAALLLGRVAEGLAPGWGAATLATFALGTLAGAFGPTTFDHVPAAALGFSAFLLAWSRRPLAAGVLAGGALLAEYQAALIVLLVGAYAALSGGRSLLRYAAGAVPGCVLLGAYDWAAFGAPWHNPLSYSDNEFEAAHGAGLLGIHLPNAHATRLVLVGDRGLLVASPVALAAAVGLWLLWRRGLRPEALLAAATTAAFVLANCGYFTPYGGDSPGPRFLVPALPFLCLGLAPAFARAPRLTGALAAASVVASTTVALTWAAAANSGTSYRQSAWGEVVRAVGGDSRLGGWAARTAPTWVGAGRVASALLVGAVALAAIGVALAGGVRRRAPAAPRPGAALAASRGAPPREP